MKKISLYLITIISLMFTGCANNYEQINPNATTVKTFEAENKVLEDLYEKKGYVLGEKAGYEKGIKFAEAAMEEYLQEIRAKQFSVYLIKEGYIEAGPTYMNPETGAVTYGCLERRPPVTVADIFNRFGSEIPTMSEAQMKKDLKQLDNKIKKIQSSVKADLFKKKVKTKVINNNNFNGIVVKMHKTKSNLELLQKIGYESHPIDKSILVKFSNKNDAENFCKNFDCI